jgi:hypothetical protein
VGATTQVVAADGADFMDENSLPNETGAPYQEGTAKFPIRAIRGWF